MAKEGLMTANVGVSCRHRRLYALSEIQAFLTNESYRLRSRMSLDSAVAGGRHLRVNRPQGET